MEAHSKFDQALKEQRSFLTEGKFVKDVEKTELPPTGGEPEPEPTEGEPEQQQPEQPEQPEEPQAPQTNFTDREQDILNVALHIYRSNQDNSIETKNEFSTMFDEGEYEGLLGRLIAVADELTD